MSRSKTGWSDYWEQDGAGGEVFVNAKGDKHPALEEHWSGVFSLVPADARVIDIASGAGSIFGHLPTDNTLDLHAADIAAEALDALKARIPGTTTVVCPADSIPYEDKSFDLVVSQFGIEYAGADAFSEAARLLGPGGQLSALVHIRDGYIDSRNKAQLAEAVLVNETGFVAQCMELTAATFSASTARMEKAEAAFVPVAQQIDAAIGRCRQGVHTHLLAGFRQLFERRAQYAKSDITGWLEGMQGEVDTTITRLTHMRAAAQSSGDMQRITDNLQVAGLIGAGYEEFRTPGNDQAVAWTLTARRP